MRLIIVRHGEVEEIIKEVVLGQMPGTLTKKGIQQHKKLAKRLKDEKIDIIYSSDLKRSKHLTKEILRYHKVPVHYLKEMREMSRGVFEGKSYKDIRKYRDEKKLDYFEFRPEKGESHIDMQKRTLNFQKKIINKYKNTNKTILFVTHGFFIIYLLFHALNLDRTRENMAKIRPFYTSVTILEIDKKGNYKAKLINCIKHL